MTIYTTAILIKTNLNTIVETISNKR